MKEDFANSNFLIRFIKGFFVVLLVEYVIRNLVPISPRMSFHSLAELVVRIASFRTHYVSVKDVEVIKPSSQSASLFSTMNDDISYLDISVIMSDSDSSIKSDAMPVKYTESLASVPGNDCYKESMDFSSDHW